MSDATKGLYLNQVLAEGKHQIKIHTPRGIVRGFITSDFNVSGGAGFSQSSPDPSFLESANDSLEGLRTLTNTAEDEARSQRKLKLAMDTVVAWTESERPTFSVDLVLVAVKNSDNVLELIKPLMSICQPTPIGGRSSEPGFVDQLEAPGGYAIDKRGKIRKGTCALEIGEYFRAPKLVITDVNISISKAILKSGKPLMVNASVTLISAKMPTSDEVKNYFR